MSRIPDEIRNDPRIFAAWVRDQQRAAEAEARQALHVHTEQPFDYGCSISTRDFGDTF